ncbi:MAG: hypothetical protein JST54_21990 [Deltaproteobacteria bacterium]|nr:hypothetical protein [Deltaproteobacteria bacterium]
MPKPPVSVRFALWLALAVAPSLAFAQSPRLRLADVPASSSDSPPIPWNPNGYAQEQQRDDALRAETFYAVGAGIVVAGYAAAAGTAMLGETTNFFGCAVSDVGSVITSTSSGPCPKTGTAVLYIPIAGPAIFFTQHERIHNVAFEGLVIMDGAIQLAGVGLLVGGVVTQASGGGGEPVSPGLKVGALKLLPSAPGALAGAQLRLDF